MSAITRLRRQRDAREAAFANLHDKLARLDLQALVRYRRAVDLHATLLDIAQRLASRRHQPGLFQQLPDCERCATERYRRYLVRHADLRTMVEVFQRPLRVRRRMKTRDDFLPQQHFEIARVAATLGFAFEPRNFLDTSKRQQLEIAPHERVGNAHQLAEHARWRP